MKSTASEQLISKPSPLQDHAFDSPTATSGISDVIQGVVSKWREIPADRIDSWNERLLKTDASYRQYPYWNEPYRKQHFSPHYLIYGTTECPSAYTCVLSIGFPRARIGLVQYGFITLRSDVEVDTSMVQSLACWAKEQGYILLRMTHSNQRVLDCVVSSGVTERRESFPFRRDPRNNLMVKQLEDEDEMLASFQQTARKEIRAALKAGYEIRVSDSPDDFASAWPMFQTHARAKGFQLPPRPLSAWLEVIRLARPHQCSRLYSAYINGQRVLSIFAVREGTTGNPMHSALDVAALRGNVSPSCLIHWHAMRDFYRSGCEFYNLGGPGDGVRNHVYQFKRKFRPILRVDPEPVTLVLKPRLYRLWSVLALQLFITWRARFRRVFNKVRSKKQLTRTIGELTAELE